MSISSRSCPRGSSPSRTWGASWARIQAEQDISFDRDAGEDAGVRQHGHGRPGRQQRGRLHGRRRQYDEHRAHVRRAQAVGRAEGPGRPRDPAPAREARARAGGDALPPGGAGRADRRAHEQRAVPVHAAEHGPQRAQRLRPADARQAPDGGGAARRRHRPAEPRAAGLPRHRSRRGLAARHPAAAHRRHALRRLRPAPGLEHLHAAEPVPRHPRGPARLPAEPRRAEVDLRQVHHRQRRCRSPPSPTSRRARRRSP